jgi:hypothetical protein
MDTEARYGKAKETCEALWPDTMFTPLNMFHWLRRVETPLLSFLYFYSSSLCPWLRKSKGEHAFFPKAPAATNSSRVSSPVTQSANLPWADGNIFFTDNDQKRTKCSEMYTIHDMPQKKRDLV